MALLLPPARDCCFSFPEILWQHLLPSGNTDKEASIDKKPNSSAAVSCLMTGLAGGTCGAQDEHNTAPRSFSPSAPPPSVLSTLPLIEALDINIVEKYQQLYFVVKNIVHLQIERGDVLKFPHIFIQYAYNRRLTFQIERLCYSMKKWAVPKRGKGMWGAELNLVWEGESATYKEEERTSYEEEEVRKKDDGCQKRGNHPRPHWVAGRRSRGWSNRSFLITFKSKKKNWQNNCFLIALKTKKNCQRWRLLGGPSLLHLIWGRWCQP